MKILNKALKNVINKHWISNFIGDYRIKSISKKHSLFEEIKNIKLNLKNKYKFKTFNEFIQLRKYKILNNKFNFFKNIDFCYDETLKADFITDENVLVQSKNIVIEENNKNNINKYSQKTSKLKNEYLYKFTAEDLINSVTKKINEICLDDKYIKINQFWFLISKELLLDNNINCKTYLNKIIKSIRREIKSRIVINNKYHEVDILIFLTLNDYTYMIKINNKKNIRYIKNILDLTFIKLKIHYDKSLWWKNSNNTPISTINNIINKIKNNIDILYKIIEVANSNKSYEDFNKIFRDSWRNFIKFDKELLITNTGKITLNLIINKQMYNIYTIYHIDWDAIKLQMKEIQKFYQTTNIEKIKKYRVAKFEIIINKDKILTIESIIKYIFDSCLTDNKLIKEACGDIDKILFEQS